VIFLVDNMKKYEECPDEYYILEECPSYIKLFKVAPSTKKTGGGYSLKVPVQFLPRFISDKEWRDVLFATYGKRLYTESRLTSVNRLCCRVLRERKPFLKFPFPAPVF
jgi:hypothetical protein